MSAFGGGGVACTSCAKTVYPAETVSFEKKPYHVDCFFCSKCEVKKNPGEMSQYEDVLYCRHCFQKEGFAQKQRNVKWKKSGGTPSAAASKFGGGGTKCTICAKTVYAAETISFEKKPYHQECFQCSQCNLKLTASGTGMYEEKLYCKKCFQTGGFVQKQRNTKWTPKTGSSAAAASKFGGGGNPCKACGKTVYAAEQLNFEKQCFHAECFKCHTCDRKMTASSAAQYEENTFCSKCFGEGGYRQKQATVTKGSGSSTASAKFSKFGGGGNKCKVCTKTVYPAETVQFEKDYYHTDCFRCSVETCSVKLGNTSSAEYTKADGKVSAIFCKKCYHEGGHNRA